MKWFLKAFKNYAGFTGRSRRMEYWFFALFNMIFLIIAAILDHIFGTTFKFNSMNGMMNLPYGYIYLIYALVILVPGLAVTFRRLHDIGKNGWNILLALIPLVGGIWLLIYMFMDSQEGENKYGPNPRDVVENV